MSRTRGRTAWSTRRDRDGHGREACDVIGVQGGYTNRWSLTLRARDFPQDCDSPRSRDREGGKGTAEGKIKALKEVGATVVIDLTNWVLALKKVFGRCKGGDDDTDTEINAVCASKTVGG